MGILPPYIRNSQQPAPGGDAAAAAPLLAPPLLCHGAVLLLRVCVALEHGGFGPRAPVPDAGAVSVQAAARSHPCWARSPSNLVAFPHHLVNDTKKSEDAADASRHRRRDDCGARAVTRRCRGRRRRGAGAVGGARNRREGLGGLRRGNRRDAAGGGERRGAGHRDEKGRGSRLASATAPRLAENA